jgi:hypothetical protein
MIYIAFKLPDVAAGSGGEEFIKQQKVPDFPWCTSMKARYLPLCMIDLCSLFLRDQFSFYLM